MPSAMDLNPISSEYAAMIDEVVHRNGLILNVNRVGSSALHPDCQPLHKRDHKESRDAAQESCHANRLLLVWLAHLLESAATLFISSPDIPQAKGGTERHTYNVVAAFGKVILKVFGVIEPSPHASLRLPVDRSVQVWPKWRVPFPWPPPVAVRDGDMAEVVGWIPFADDKNAPTVIETYRGVE